MEEYIEEYIDVCFLYFKRRPPGSEYTSNMLLSSNEQLESDVFVMFGIFIAFEGLQKASFVGGGGTTGLLEGDWTKKKRFNVM
jgi:hypothetical protein